MAGGPTVGLDIGSNLMKVVEVRRGANGLQVVALGVAPTPPEAFDNGVLVDTQLLGQAVKNLLKQAGVSTKHCVSSVSGQSVVVRVIDVPVMSPNELAETMKWEVERHVPFAVNEVIMDYQPIERPEGVAEGQNMEVLLAVAQQDMVDRHVEMLFAAGLKPSAIDVEPLAASRCLLDLGGNGHQPGYAVAIVNIGASNTDIGIYRDNLIAFPRTLPQGGDHLTRAIAAALQVDLITAENYKREYGEVMLGQVQQSAPNFGGGMSAGGSEGFTDFSAPAAPTGPGSPSGPMPFDFSTPNDAPPPAPEPSAPNPFDLSGGAAPTPFGTPPQPEPPNPFAQPDPGFLNAPPPTNMGGGMNLPATIPGAPGDPGLDAMRIQVFNAMAPGLQELAQELRRSLDYYRGKAADPTIHEMLLVGGSANLRNLAPFLESELGIPTRVADPLRAVQVTSKNYSQAHLEEIASLFSISIGLGARDFIATSTGGKSKSKKRG